jgi:MFS family permease
VTESLRAPLTQRRFRWLWLASVLSNLGGFLQAVAGSWLMLELTGSPQWVAAMAASTTLPLLFLALPAGALADLTNRRNLLLTAQVLMLGAVAGMAVLAATGHITPETLLALGLALGIGVALNAPVWQAMVPDLVPRQMVASAVALNSISFNVARAVGPAIGGLLVATAGPDVAFAANAVTYAVVVAVVVTFRSSDWTPEEESSFSRAITLGIRFARFTPELRRLLAVAALFGLTAAAVQVLLPNLTSDRYDGGAGTYGVLLGAMGLGALVGGMTRSPIGARLRWSTVPTGIALHGVAGIGVGLVPEAWAAAPLLALAGLAWVWTLATLNTTIQAISPTWVRGRTLSLYMLAFSGVYPVGSLLAGNVAEAVGVPASITALSSGCLIVGLLALRIRVIGLDEVSVPQAPVDWDRQPHGATGALGGPVLILNTWVIDPGRLDEFLAVLADLRLVRLRTGATVWRLYRNVDDPRRITEAFNLATWDDHLLQHGRIDEAAAEVIRKARTFDVGDGPVGRHLVAFDIADPHRRPHLDELALQHLAAHEQDGSIPLLSVDPAIGGEADPLTEPARPE